MGDDNVTGAIAQYLVALFTSIPPMCGYVSADDSAFQTFNTLREVFPSADLVSNFTVFNISGNNYRLITYIDYEYQIVFVRAVLTHAEYNKENWKNDDWFKNS